MGSKRKEVRKTRNKQVWNPSTSSYDTVTETYSVFETINDSTGGSCGGANDWSSNDSGGGYCGE